MTIEQGSPEWFEQRLGKVTASKIADVMATVKTGEAASRANYRIKLALERLTGKREESFTTTAMDHGTEYEPVARALYEVYRDVEVSEVGLIDHPTIPMAGASPDGLIGDDGCLEIKCFQPANHTTYLLTRKIEKKYMLQMQFQMACTGRQWCDFVAYQPFFPDHLQILIIRVPRDDESIKEIEDEVSKFLVEVDDVTTKLRELVVDR